MNLLETCQSDISDSEALNRYNSQEWTNEAYGEISEDPFKNTPLLYAIATGKPQLAQRIANDMIERKLTDLIDKTDGYDEQCGNTPLSLAIKMGYEPLALDLLNSKTINIHRVFRYGNNYLHFANIARLDDVAAMLIHYEINQKQKNKWGILPADYRRYPFMEIDLKPYPSSHIGNYLVLPDLNDFSFHTGKENIIAKGPNTGPLSQTFCKRVFNRYTHVLKYYKDVLETANQTALAANITAVLNLYPKLNASNFYPSVNSFRDKINEVTEFLETKAPMDRIKLYLATKDLKTKAKLSPRLNTFRSNLQQLEQNRNLPVPLTRAFKNLDKALYNDLNKSNHRSINIVFEHFDTIIQALLANKTFTASDLERSAQNLDKKLGNPLFSPNVKSIICGVFGALIGFALGLVVGATITSWGGGFGAFVGALLAGVQGFTIGTGLGIGAAVVSSPIITHTVKKNSVRSDAAFFSTKETILKESREVFNALRSVTAPPLS